MTTAAPQPLHPEGAPSITRGGADAEARGRRGVILHVITRYIPYGASRNLQFVLDWEARHGYKPHLAVGGTVSFDVPPNVVVHRIPALRRSPMPVDDVRALFLIRQLVDNVRPAVLQTHQSKSGILGRLAGRARVPALIHTIHMPSFGAGYGGPASIAYRAMERRCGRFTDFFVAVGKDLQQMYVDAGIGRRDQYRVIHSYVELDRYVTIRSATNAQRLGWRRRYGIPADAPVLLVAGLLEPRKRVDLIVRRLAPLLAAGRATLVIAGDGSERGALEGLVKRIGLGQSVIFVGFVSELSEVLGLSDALVHASSSEGIAQVVLQAAAAGKPIVATESTGLSEIPGNAVTTVDRDGTRLLKTCESVLSARIAPATTPDDFRPWSAETIDRQLATLHQAVDDLVGRRRQDD